MSINSKIEWTDATWNPTRGCTRVSPGCQHCYAETWAERFRGVKGHPYERGFDLCLAPQLLLEPFKWGTGKMVFVNSMSDLFHEDISDDYIVQVAHIMQATNWHTYQVLTKRAERMAGLLKTKLRFAATLPYVWWGVSVENKKHGLPRLVALRDAPAIVRFLSCEPLLEDLGELDLCGIHWLIAGGESGPGARPMNPSWVRKLRTQCLKQKVPFFFKQWGGVRKHITGRELDGRTWDDFPARGNIHIPDLRQRRALIQKFEPEADRFRQRKAQNTESPMHSDVQRDLDIGRLMTGAKLTGH
jgi:protein gp37